MPRRPLRLFGDPADHWPAAPAVDIDRELRRLVAELFDAGRVSALDPRTAAAGSGCRQKHPDPPQIRRR